MSCVSFFDSSGSLSPRRSSPAGSGAALADVGVPLCPVICGCKLCPKDEVGTKGLKVVDAVGCVVIPLADPDA